MEEIKLGILDVVSKKMKLFLWPETNSLFSLELDSQIHDELEAEPYSEIMNDLSPEINQMIDNG
jgi:hypothetical protein